MSQKKILFISHEASRTGAPILLLSLMRWLNKNVPEYEIYSLLVNGGELLPEFEKISKKVFYPNKKYNNSIFFVKHFLEKNNSKRTYKEINELNFEIIFSNTITNGKILNHINTLESKVITYVHELATNIKNYDKIGQVQGTIENTNIFIAGSEIVKENLIENYTKINNKNCFVVNSFTDLDKFVFDNNKRTQLRSKYNINENDFVVGMVGNQSWRKGEDIFFYLALLNNIKNVHFFWIGASNEDRNEQLGYDLKKINQSLNIHYFPASAKYSEFYNMFDCFFLSSREDPYPLVMIEAAAYGLPIIYFKKTGGADEFLSKNFSFGVNYLSLKEVYQQIEYIKENVKNFSHKKKELIENNKALHDIENGANKILKILL